MAPLSHLLRVPVEPSLDGLDDVFVFAVGGIDAVHELSIAQSLVELACDHAAQKGADRTSRVEVRLGVLSGSRRALYFYCGAASKGTRCEGAALDIEEVPLTVFCAGCEEVKSPPALYSFRCPTCGMPTPKVVTGREMQLVSLALDFAEPPPAADPAADTRDTNKAINLDG